MNDIDDDSGSTEFWRDIKQARQAKIAINRELSAQILADEGILFESKNLGAHLIVKHNNKIVDFWPGTGRWIDRDRKHGFGIRNLLAHLAIQQP